MRNRTKRYLIQGVAEVGCAMPLLWFLGVLSLYLRAQAHLGIWPQPNLNDPKLLPFEAHHAILVIGMAPVIATGIVLPLMWLLRKRVSLAGVGRQAATYAIGCLLIVAAFVIPGFEVITWFLD